MKDKTHEEREKLDYDTLKEMLDKLKQPDPKGLILLPSTLNLEGFDVIEMPANEIRLMLLKIRNKDKCKEFVPDIRYLSQASTNSLTKCSNCGKTMLEHINDLKQ